jgi:hypothetical protein
MNNRGSLFLNLMARTVKCSDLGYETVRTVKSIKISVFFSQKRGMDRGEEEVGGGGF